MVVRGTRNGEKTSVQGEMENLAAPPSPSGASHAQLSPRFDSKFSSVNVAFYVLTLFMSSLRKDP